MIADEGLPNIYNRHQVLAQTVWAAVQAWGKDGPMQLNVAAPEKRSHAITSIRLASPLAGQLQDWTSQNIGLTLGIGLGMEPADGFFRIGHMGHVNGQMVMAALGGIDAGLKAIKAPHGQDALTAASAMLASAQTGQSTISNSSGDKKPKPSKCCG